MPDPEPEPEAEPSPEHEDIDELSQGGPPETAYKGRGRPKGAPRSSQYRGVTKHRRSGR